MRPPLSDERSDLSVVSFITSAEQGIAEIPPLLKDKPLLAVVLGGGYNDEDFGKMKEAAQAAGSKSVPWLRPDMTKGGPKDIGPDYPKVVAERAKTALMGMKSGDGSDLVLF